MQGYRARIIKVHHKPSWKSCDKTKIRVIFIGDTVSQGTFEHKYDVCPIKKFSGGRRVIGNNKVGGYKFVVVKDESYFLVGSGRRTFFVYIFFEICSSILYLLWNWFL